MIQRKMIGLKSLCLECLRESAKCENLEKYPYF